MAVISRRSKRRGSRYVVRLRDVDGKWYPTKTFPTKPEAREYEAELLRIRARGQRATSKDSRLLTVVDYWADWASECRGRCSVGWRKSQDQMFRDYIVPAIGAKRLLELTERDCAKVMAAAAGRSPQLRVHVFNLLHRLLEDSIEHFRYRESNPLRKELRPKVPVVERAFLKPEEAWKLLEAVQNHYLGPAVWLCALAGLRSGEAQALQWRNVALDRAEILVDTQWRRREGAFATVKGGRPHRVPIIPRLAEYLAARQGDPAAFVVKNVDGTTMLPHTTFSKTLPKLCALAGVPEVTIHELRHSCTEIWIQAGASEEDIKRLLNHSSASTTRRYIHRTDERLERIAQGIKSGGGHLRLVSRAAGSGGENV